MKIAVVAANGKAGQAIVKEAEERGLDVTAFGRGANKTVAKSYIQRDIFDLKPADLAGFDAVITAFGAWTPETLPQHSSSLLRLCDLLSGTKTRLLAVGGAGSLYVDEAHSRQLMDTPDFPEDYKPLAGAMAEGLTKLRERRDVQWTYVSPAADFEAEGAKTGKYITAGEVFTCNGKGESFISYADYAAAMVDEVQKGNHLQQRISVLAE